MVSNTHSYDIVTVGGGLAGSAIAKAMADRGADVLVLERETRMRDRVRGEHMWPWGVAEAIDLGIYDALLEGGGHKTPYINMYRGATPTGRRNLEETSPQKLPSMAFYHPQMQESLLEAAASAGAEVHRGVRVSRVTPGPAPAVEYVQDGREVEVRSRLVVGADGRTSSVRKWGRFRSQKDPDQNYISGLLFDDMPVLEDTAHLHPFPKFGLLAVFFPQGQGRARSYFCYPAAEGHRLGGGKDIQRFVEGVLKVGLPAEYFEAAKVAGPLATFSGAHTWVDHPYKDGVALMGDAAATSDPTHGQGLSKTLRDARVLRDKLTANENWDEAGHAYAEEHDRYYEINHTFENWISKLLLETGPDADALRAKALPTWPRDITGPINPLFCGPNAPLDEVDRMQFFGEE